MRRHLQVVLTLTLGLSTFGLSAADAAGPSQASAFSVAPSVLLLDATLTALPLGCELVVSATRVVGTAGVLTISAVGTSVEMSVEVSADVASRAATLGTRSVEVVSTTGGHLLLLAGESIAFIPDAVGQQMIHHRELY